MKNNLKKLFAVLVASSMALSMGAVGASAAPPPPPPGGGSMTFYLSDAVTELESGSYSDTTFENSTNASEVAVRAGDGVVADLNNVTITKTAGDTSGDDSSFYGVNTALLVYGQKDASNVTVKDSSISSSASGANGVFAYGKGVVSISESEVTTTGSGGSGGIMVAGGGTLYALNLDVTTEGGSSAAIRSDRGSGKMVVDQGIYVANGSKGTGSPAIYCVADITVANSTLVAKNAQAVCFEGRNPAWIYNCWVEGQYTASDDDENSNVMVYQSMSGDSEEGTSSYTMVGGVLKANNTSAKGNAKMFYTTNTYCYINLADVEMIYSDGMETFLLCACNTNQRGWGTAGQNGSECVLYTVEQDIDGDIIYDTWSLLYCYFTDGTVANTALVCREDNGDRGAYVYMDADSSWIVTGDSVVNELHTGGAAIVDDAGKTVSIVGADGTAYVTGDSQYTITVTDAYSTEDKSAYEQVPVIGTAKPAFVYDYEELGIDTSVYTPVCEADYVYTPGASVSVAALSEIFPDAVKTEPEIAFTDVTENDWFYAEVMKAAQAGIVSGTGNGVFEPNANVTRAQAAKMIAVAMGLYINSGETSFADVPADQWYAPYVAAAVKADAMKGQSATIFNPDASLTRAEAAALMVQALGLPAEGTADFNDVTAADWFADEVAAAVKAGIVKGTGDGNYTPNQSVTRAELAAMIVRAFLPDVDAPVLPELPDPALPDIDQPTPPEGEQPADPPAPENPGPSEPEPPVEDEPAPEPPVEEDPAPEPPADEGGEPSDDGTSGSKPDGVTLPSPEKGDGSFAAYQAYLYACADVLWPGDGFLATAYNDIAGLTEGTYSSSLIYTILVDHMGAMSYEAWKA